MSCANPNCDDSSCIPNDFCGVISGKRRTRGFQRFGTPTLRSKTKDTAPTETTASTNDSTKVDAKSDDKTDNDNESSKTSSTDSDTSSSNSSGDFWEDIEVKKPFPDVFPAVSRKDQIALLKRGNKKTKESKINSDDKNEDIDTENELFESEAVNSCTDPNCTDGQCKIPSQMKASTAAHSTCVDPSCSNPNCTTGTGKGDPTNARYAFVGIIGVLIAFMVGYVFYMKKMGKKIAT